MQSFIFLFNFVKSVKKNFRIKQIFYFSMNPHSRRD